MKHCNHCNTEKPKSQFYKNKFTKDGRSYQCADCSRAIQRKSKSKAPLLTTRQIKHQNPGLYSKTLGAQA
jgi:transposase-like protein